MQDEMIWIVTNDTIRDSGSDVEYRDYRDIIRERGVKVSVSELQQNMLHFLKSVGQIFHQAEKLSIYSDLMQLDEIVLSVEISGEGEVKLMGTGGKAGGKGAITLKFKRIETQTEA